VMDLVQLGLPDSHLEARLDHETVRGSLIMSSYTMPGIFKSPVHRIDSDRDKARSGRYADEMS
jgi:hypothetical protein